MKTEADRFPPVDALTTFEADTATAVLARDGTGSCSTTALSVDDPLATEAAAEVTGRAPRPMATV